MPKAPLFGVGYVSLPITRYESGSYVDGNYVIGSSETFNIVANVQPAKYYETLILPEGKRSTEVIKVYSRCEIRAEKPGDNGWGADQILWNDKLFEVFRVQQYQMGILDHYKAICYLIELTP